MVIYVTMIYGPIAAFLVELFPARIRCTSMSLPYHIGNGWFGGMLPPLATAIVAKARNIYTGLWYPIIVPLMTVVIGALASKGDQTHPNPRRALILQRSQGIPGSGAYMASGARCFSCRVLGLPDRVGRGRSSLAPPNFGGAGDHFSYLWEAVCPVGQRETLFQTRITELSMRLLDQHPRHGACN